MKVYALVGTSGTGKSYKALELAYERDIEYIIDDGLLIHKNKILAGKSAKQAKTTMEAVKRAIFNEEQHKNSVQDKLKNMDIDNILILGTSNKMIKRILKRLEINPEYELINIEDISSEYEIEMARKSRKNGNHVIPVPSLEIKQISNGISINSIKKLFRKSSNNYRMIEKTIIRPPFSYIGRFYISENAIKQIVDFELKNMDGVGKINKIDVININNNIKIKISINVKKVEVIKNIELVQEILKTKLENITMMNVYAIDIRINKLKINY